MKVLLIGEFSGVHNNLKKGLVELGHNVTLAADGDGYRGFDSDIKLKKYSTNNYSKFIKLFIHLKNIIYLLSNYRIIFGNDAVQFISPFSIQSTYSFITFLIIKFNKQSFYYACGTDPAFLASKDKFEYFAFDDETSKDYPKYSKSTIDYYNKFIIKVNKIIPSMYGYMVGYEGNDKLIKNIKLPIVTNQSIMNIPSNKIRILHGITRYDSKGSKFIIEALKRIVEEFKDIVEVSIVEKLPFDEYYQLYNNVDIIVDQCKSYEYGMNALNALASGKIVLSGSEEIALRYFGINKSPIINIIPNSIQIYDSLKSIITLNSYEYSHKKAQGLPYVEGYHNYITITKEFVEEYKK